MTGEQNVQEKEVSKMGVHTHVQLPQHRSGPRLNGKNALIVGVVNTVIGEGIPRGAVGDRDTEKVVGRLAGKG